MVVADALILGLALLAAAQAPAPDRPAGGGAAEAPAVKDVWVVEETPDGVRAYVDDRMVLLDRRPAPGDDGDPVVADVRDLILASKNFDDAVFSQAPQPRVRRPHLHFILEFRIGKVDERRQLTDPERARLRLAGTGDIQRYLNRVEAARQAFEATRHDYPSGLERLRGLDDLAVGFRQGPFGAGSLYAKTLAAIEKDRR